MYSQFQFSFLETGDFLFKVNSQNQNYTHEAPQMIFSLLMSRKICWLFKRKKFSIYFYLSCAHSFHIFYFFSSHNFADKISSFDKINHFKLIHTSIHPRNLLQQSIILKMIIINLQLQKSKMCRKIFILIA